MKNIKFTLILLTIFSITSTLSQNGKGAAYKEITKPNNDLSETILEQEMLNLIHKVVRKGKLIKDVKSNILQSSWVERVRLYRYLKSYYVVASLKTKDFFKDYIYCDITPDSWNKFTSTEDLAYGDSFYLYIHPKKCY